MEERLLIAGMSGVIGRQLALVGLEQGFKVFGTVQKSIPPELDFLEREGKLIVFKVDLRQRNQVEKIVSVVRPNVVVNLAGHSESNPNLGRLVLDENMAILENLLDSSLYSGRGRERLERDITFIQAGTIWEYGQTFGEIPITEIPYDRLPTPLDSNYYVQSKVAAEELLLTLFQKGVGINPILLRFAHHTGEGKKTGMTGIGADAVSRVRNGVEDAIMIRNKLGRIDLSYARDGARAIACLIHQGTPGEAYNVARGNDNSIEEILMIMARRLDLSPLVEVVSTGEEYETHARFSIQKLLSLGYQPNFSLTQTIERFVDWYCQRDKNIDNYPEVLISSSKRVTPVFAQA